MRHSMRAFMILLLAVIACAVSRPPSPDTSSSPPRTEEETQTPSEEPSQPNRLTFEPPVVSAVPSSGTLAVIGHDGNVYQINATNGLSAVTHDGIIDPHTPGSSTYSHPTWSRDGWLSFVRADNGSTAPTLAVQAMHPTSVEPRTLLTTSDSGYIYGYWSPTSPCDGDAVCGRLAYLMSGGTSIELHLASVSTDAGVEPSDVILDRASPFYYSWSSDGQYMLWHQNSSVLGIFDTQSETVDELPDIPGSFQAPSWSPVDSRLLFAVEDGPNSTIQIAAEDDRLSVGSGTDAASYFLWSPDGTQIAHANGDYPLQNLTITRVDSGQAVKPDTPEDVIAFFWSPDSEKLAVVTVEPYIPPLPEALHSGHRARPLRQQEDVPAVVLAWWLVDATTGEARRLTQFLATPDQFYIFQYFDQYAQSHQLWSPNSQYLAYAQIPLSGGDPEVMLLDTSEPSPIPEFVIHGLQAVFSFAD